MRAKTTTLLALTLLLGLGCQPNTTAPGPAPAPDQAPKIDEPMADAPIMKTYEVPKGRASELASVLRSALSNGDQPPRGTVTRLDDGRLVVVAPAAVHEGVDQLCEELASGEPAPPPATVIFDYWILRAEPAAEPDASSLPRELMEVGQEILAQAGARLSLLERLELSSMSNERASVHGRRVHIEHRAAVRDGQIVADVEIELETMESELRTRINIDAGQFAVLGQAGYGNLDAPQDTAEGTLYYVVRARISEG